MRILSPTFEKHDGACFAHMQSANSNDDDELDQQEYVHFVHDMMEQGGGNIFLLFQLDQLPQQLQDNFYKLCSSCQEDGNGDNCCHSISVKGLSQHETATKEQVEWLDYICEETKNAIPPSSTAATTATTAVVQGGAAISSDASVSFRQSSSNDCFRTLNLADTDFDGRLDREDFVVLANRFSDSDLGLAFDELPPALQQVFLSRTNDDGTLPLDGILLGQNATLEQSAFLTEVCGAITMAIQNDRNNSLLTTAPTPSPAVITANNNEDEGTTPTPGPTMMPLHQCYLQLTIADWDGNGFLNQTDYIRLVNQLSLRSFYSATQLSDLPRLLEDLYADLAQTPELGISVSGSRPGQSADFARQGYLTNVCAEVADAVNQATQPSISPAPTRPPSAPEAPPTPAPTTKTPTPPPIFGSAPTNPGSSFTIPPVQFTPLPTPGPTPRPTTLAPTALPTIPETPAPITLAPITSAPITLAPITPTPTTLAPITPIPTTSAPSAGNTPAPAVLILPPTPEPTISGTTPAPVPITPAPAGVGTPAPAGAVTPAPAPAMGQPSTPPSIKPSASSLPSGAPSKNPSISPAPSRTVVATPEPTPQPTFPPGVPTFPPTTASPSASPTARFGINGRFMGNATFNISNSKGLSALHLVSGRTRSSLSQAFNMVVQSVIDQRSLGGGESSSSSSSSLPQKPPPSISGGVRRRQEQISRRRWLVVRLEQGGVYRVDDSECREGVPDGFNCMMCFASFVVRAANELPTTQNIPVEYSRAVQDAITQGELQIDLDTVYPNSQVTIEEGDDVQRPSLSVFSEDGVFSRRNIAFIGAGTFLVLVMTYCYFMRCRRCRKKKVDDEDEDEDEK